MAVDNRLGTNNGSHRHPNVMPHQEMVMQAMSRYVTLTKSYACDLICPRAVFPHALLTFRVVWALIVYQSSYHHHARRSQSLLQCQAYNPRHLKCYCTRSPTFLAPGSAHLHEMYHVHASWRHGLYHVEHGHLLVGRTISTSSEVDKRSITVVGANSNHPLDKPCSVVILDIYVSCQSLSHLQAPRLSLLHATYMLTCTCLPSLLRRCLQALQC